MGLKKISKKEEEFLKEQTKELSIKEGVATSVMDGAGLNYITPYALSIGANNAQIGFLSSIPSLLGNLSQIFTSKFVGKYPRKKIVFVSVLLQAFMWIPIIIIGYLFYNKTIGNEFGATLLILFFTLLTLFGSFSSPAWNSLIRDNVDKERGNFFGKRNKIIRTVVIFVMLVGGLILNSYSRINIFKGFMILFVTAFIARLISAYFIKKHYEPELKLEKENYFSIFQFIKGIPKSNFGKFSLFVGLISLTSSIASPFLVVYLLKDLNMEYFIWTIVIISNSAGMLLFMPLWGKLSDKHGNLKVMKWAGVFIWLIPVSWLFIIFFANISLFVSIGYLILIEFFSGFVWAGFNLSAANFIYDAVSREKLALCVSYYNIFNGVGVFIGASMGGIIASMNFNLWIISPILFLFIFSAIARLLVYVIMIPKIKEVKEFQPYAKGELKEELKRMLMPSPFKFLRHNPNEHNEFIIN